MSVTEIFNFIAIDDRIATAGQPTEAQFREARDAGYEVVVNLAPDGHETSLPHERELLDALGFEYHYIPVAWTGPRLHELDRFEAAMTAAAGRRTLVHCAANYRVTAFFALYAQRRLGWSAQQADALISRIWTSRPDYTMDDTWAAFIAAARARPQTNGPPA